MGWLVGGRGQGVSGLPEDMQLVDLSSSEISVPFLSSWLYGIHVEVCM